MEQEGFKVLDNTVIGKNIAMYRKIRDIKAFDIAERLGMKEQTYTKYERGETQITVDFVQKVAEILKVDPLMLLSVSPNNIIENGNNSPIAIHGYNQTINDEQIKLMTKLVENVMFMNEKIMALLDKK